MAPHTPQRSEHPGAAGALLDIPPQRSERPGAAGALRDMALESFGALTQRGLLGKVVPTGRYMMIAKAPSQTLRPRDGRSAREAILDSATRLMGVHGYRNTALDEVLRESGVGKGNFYHYFRSKEELGYAILDQFIGVFLDRTLRPCFSEGGGSPLDQIRCFFDRVREIQRERNCVGGCPLGNLAAELSDLHEGFRGRLNGVFSTWRERLTKSLREAQEGGDVRADCQPEAVAHFLVAALEGAMLMTKLTKDIGVMEQCVCEMKRYLALYEVAA